MGIKTIILAAGQGTRMKSKYPKVIHKVCGLPLVEHVIRLSGVVSDSKPVVVVGHGAEEVRKALNHLDVAFALQEQQLGTGHAVKMAREEILPGETVLILYGDTPLIEEATLESFIADHQNQGRDLSVLTMRVPDPTGYGRIIRIQGKLGKIV